MAAAESFPVRWGIAAVVVAALAALVAWGAWALPALLALEGDASLLAGVLVVVAWALHRVTFLVPIRRERVVTCLDEAALVVALATLPLPVAPLVMLPAYVAAQVERRRRLPKAAFNVANHVLCAFAASLLFGALAPLVGTLPAAGLALPLYTVGTQVGLSFLIARLEGEAPLRIFRERLLEPAAVQWTIGLGGAVVALALWSYHPAALLALVPFALLARSYADHHARARRVLRVHARLERLAGTLARPRNDEEVALATLATAADLLPNARLEMFLIDLTGPSRTWRRDPVGEVTEDHLEEVAVVAPDGTPFGVLRAGLPSRAAPEAPATVRLLAAEAAAALDRIRRRELEARVRR